MTTIEKKRYDEVDRNIRNDAFIVMCADGSPNDMDVSEGRDMYDATWIFVDSELRWVYFPEGEVWDVKCLQFYDEYQFLEQIDELITEGF